MPSGLQTTASASGGSDHDDLSIDVERVIEFSSDEGKFMANFEVLFQNVSYCSVKILCKLLHNVVGLLG